jgi:hypothetical protein
MNRNCCDCEEFGIFTRFEPTEYEKAAFGLLPMRLSTDTLTSIASACLDGSTAGSSPLNMNITLTLWSRLRC